MSAPDVLHDLLTESEAVVRSFWVVQRADTGLFVVKSKGIYSVVKWGPLDKARTFAHRGHATNSMHATRRKAIQYARFHGRSPEEIPDFRVVEVTSYLVLKP